MKRKRKDEDVYMVCVERIDGKVFRSKDVMDMWGVKTSDRSNVCCLSIGLKRRKEEAFLLYEKAKENFNLSEYKVTIELLENEKEAQAKLSFWRALAIVVDVLLIVMCNAMIIKILLEILNKHN